MGHEATQSHTFNCSSCKEPLTIEVVVGESKSATEMPPIEINCVDNCEDSDEEGMIINLHADYTIPEDQLHVDQAFPWLDQLRQIVKIQAEEGAEKPDLDNIEELHEFKKQIATAFENWPVIKKSWSLTLNGRDDLAEKLLPNYNGYKFDGPFQFKHVLYDFLVTLLVPKKIKIFKEAVDITFDTSRRFEHEYSRFRQYYSEEIVNESLPRYFEIFKEYFNAYTEFNQTLNYSRYGLEFPEDAQASSALYSKTKMFYGNAFEGITSNYVTLACLNNVKQGRKFDKFESMDLKKYLTINKGNRSKTFVDTPQYYAFAEGQESTLRNSSHHGAMKIDQKGRVITYRSGGTGGTRKIAYAKYLYYCNEIFLQTAALLMLEVAFSYER